MLESELPHPSTNKEIKIMTNEQLETELSKLAGKMQALTNLNLALAITHPDPASLLVILDKLSEQAKAQIPSKAFQYGIDSIQNDLKNAIATIAGTELLQQHPKSVGH